MTKLILGALAGFALISAPAAMARTTIIEPIGTIRPYQQFVDEAAVPTPNVTLEIIEQANGQADQWCIEHGTLDAAGCTDKTEHIALVRFEVKAVFLHELGHVFDNLDMTPGARTAFLRVIGRPGLAWEDAGAVGGGDWGSGTEAGAEEWFADAYSLCARGIAFRPGAIYEIGDGEEDAATMRAACRLIRSVPA